MTRPLSVSFTVLLLLLSRVAAAGAVDEVLAADAEFAARAAEVGQQLAFIENLAPDAVLFRPEAVAAQEWLATHEPAPGRLEWSPAAAAVACSGRLAISSGRWRYANDAGGEPVAGHYLSVWRRDAGGRWQVVLDHGVDHAADDPAEPLAGAFARLWTSAGDGRCSGRSGARALAAADAQLNDRVPDGLGAALRREAAERAIAYRDDAAPGRMTDDGAAGDARFGPGASAQIVGTIFDPDGDLGVTHGLLKSADGGRAVYVRVWQRDRRRWRLAIDLQAPLPAPQ